MKKMNLARIFAILALILFALLLIATIIFAFLSASWSHAAFRACLYALIVVPILGYIFSHYAKVLSQYAGNSEEDKASESRESTEDDTDR